VVVLLCLLLLNFLWLLLLLLLLLLQTARSFRAVALPLMPYAAHTGRGILMDTGATEGAGRVEAIILF